ncbi:hypothetical protein DSUL_80027 [Desulfovibrionales bacterium]
MEEFFFVGHSRHDKIQGVLSDGLLVLDKFIKCSGKISYY